MNDLIVSNCKQRTKNSKSYSQYHKTKNKPKPMLNNPKMSAFKSSRTTPDIESDPRVDERQIQKSPIIPLIQL